MYRVGIIRASSDYYMSVPLETLDLSVEEMILYDT